MTPAFWCTKSWLLLAVIFFSISDFASLALLNNHTISDFSTYSLGWQLLDLPLDALAHCPVEIQCWEFSFIQGFCQSCALVTPSLELDSSYLMRPRVSYSVHEVMLHFNLLSDKAIVNQMHGKTDFFHSMLRFGFLAFILVLLLECWQLIWPLQLWVDSSCGCKKTDFSKTGNKRSL